MQFGVMTDVQAIRSAVKQRACAVALVCVAAIAHQACAPPYSAKAYRKYEHEVLYATICHDGKRTINVPAEQWPEYKAKGAYRGPCRNRGPVGPAEPPAPDETLTAYEGGRRRAKLSEEAWERHQALLAAQLDSTTSQRGRARRDEPARDGAAREGATPQ